MLKDNVEKNRELKGSQSSLQEIISHMSTAFVSINVKALKDLGDPHKCKFTALFKQMKVKPNTNQFAIACYLVSCLLNKRK